MSCQTICLFIKPYLFISIFLPDSLLYNSCNIYHHLYTTRCLNLYTHLSIQGVASTLDGVKRSIEYLQDYIGIAGLKIFQQEFARIINYHTEQESNRFVKRKIFDRYDIITVDDDDSDIDSDGQDFSDDDSHDVGNDDCNVGNEDDLDDDGDSDDDNDDDVFSPPLSIVHHVIKVKRFQSQEQLHYLNHQLHHHHHHQYPFLHLHSLPPPHHHQLELD